MANASSNRRIWPSRNALLLIAAMKSGRSATARSNHGNASSWRSSECRASPILEQVSAVVGRLPKARCELERMLKAENVVIGPLQIDQDITEVLPKLGHVGPELVRLFARLQVVVGASHLLQRRAEARQLFRPRVLPDGAGNPLQRVIVLLGV